MNAPVNPSATAVSRRFLLKAMGGAGVGLMVGAMLPKGLVGEAKAATGDLAFNPFVKIAPDGTVTVLIKHLDKGQGIATGLSTLVAEELDADWAHVRPEFSPANTELYKNLFFGIQGTGGSTSIANSFEQYRKAGATARAMLVAAAAKDWGVPAGEITVEAGRLGHASGKSGSFGDFAEKAASLPAPAEVKLKDAANFKLIGKEGLHRLDNDAKTSGKAVYTQDIHLDGMVVAVVAHPPKFGAKPKSFKADAAKAVKGVVEVVSVPQGVAVLAKTTHAAIKGRDALEVEWDESAAETRGTEELTAEYTKALGEPGKLASQGGDIDAAFKASGAKIIEADFSFPYLAHAAMEPLNAVVEIKGDKVEIWTGAQFQTVDQMVVAAIAGTTPDKVTINTLWAGGSFGRRAVPTSDYIAEAATIAKAYGKGPVKMVWTREDDTRGGYYRPMYMHRVRAAVDASGKPLAWHHRVVGQSIMMGTAMEAMVVKDGIDETSIEGVSDLGYELPNFRTELNTTKVGVPVLWWRSVGHTHTAHAVEVMIDELAHAAGKDPVAFRLELIKEPRLKAVLELAAEKAGWGSDLGPNRGRGVAAHKSFNTYVAEIAEVTMLEGGKVKVDRVVAAVDCGVVVNPDVLRAQVEGGVGFGLGHALHAAITLTGGQVDQANFDSYEPLRMSEMPKVEVYTIASDAAPTGIGEPAVPPVAPAVANAIFAATGKRVYSLPFATQKLGA